MKKSLRIRPVLVLLPMFFVLLTGMEQCQVVRAIDGTTGERIFSLNKYRHHAEILVRRLDKKYPGTPKCRSKNLRFIDKGLAVSNA